MRYSHEEYDAAIRRALRKVESVRRDALSEKYDTDTMRATGEYSHEEYDKAIRAAIESQRNYSHEDYDRAIARALGVNKNKDKIEKISENILTDVENNDKIKELMNEDAVPRRWITVKGTHVPLDKNGVAISGPFKGQNFSDAPKREANVNGSSHTQEYIDKYFSAHKDDEAAIKEEAKSYMNILDAVQDFESAFGDKEDGTYDVNTGEAVDFDRGFSVTFHQNHSLDDPYADYTPETYAIMCAISKRELGSEGVYIGKFNGHAEVSFHCKSRRQALRFARTHNQASTWDCKKGVAIPNYKTYDRKTNPT